MCSWKYQKRRGIIQARKTVGPWAHPHSMTWPHTTKATSMQPFIPITGAEAQMANHRKDRRNTGKFGHLSSTQRDRECRSIPLSPFWGKGQTLFTTQLDSCKPPVQSSSVHNLFVLLRAMVCISVLVYNIRCNVWQPPSLLLVTRSSVLS